MPVAEAEGDIEGGAGGAAEIFVSVGCLGAEVVIKVERD